MTVTAARRQRLGLALAMALGLVLALVGIASGGSGTAAPPAAAAATVVPGDALVYVHLSVDPHRAPVRQALALARRLPNLAALGSGLLGRITAIAGGGTPVDFTRDIRPWLGREAALAVMNTTGATAGSLIVLDVADRSRARAFLARAGAAPAGSDRGVALLRYGTGTEAAFLAGHLLVLGQDASVRSAIAVAAGAAGSLAADPAYRRAAAGEPPDRVLDAYASAAGVRRVLEARSGIVGALGRLLDRPALAGAAVSLSPASGGARIHLHTVLDPTLVRAGGGPGPTVFAPTLPRAIPANAALMLDTSGFRRLAPRVLAAAAAAGLATQLAPLLHRLGSALAAEGVNVQQLLSVFDGETALAILPGSAAHPAPALVILTRARDQASVSQTLASLEAPLAQLFAAPANGPGQAPEFNDRQVAGVTTHQLALGPGLQLDYAVFDGLLAVSTSLDGIAAVAQRSGSLSDLPAFRATLDANSGRSSSLLFLDFSQLLSLGEQTGLTRGAQFQALRPDLERIRAVGMDSTSGEADTTAELFLQIP